jgi:hypothetical protein
VEKNREEIRGLRGLKEVMKSLESESMEKRKAFKKKLDDFRKVRLD